MHGLNCVHTHSFDVVVHWTCPTVRGQDNWICTCAPVTSGMTFGIMSGMMSVSVSWLSFGARRPVCDDSSPVSEWPRTEWANPK